MEYENTKYLNVISGLVCAGLGGFIIILTFTTFPKEELAIGGLFASARFYPQLVASLMILLGSLMCISTLVKKSKSSLYNKQGKNDYPSQNPNKDQNSTITPKSKTVMKMVAISFCLFTYTALLEPIGYFILTPLVMFALFRLLDITNWITIVVLSLVTSFSVGIFFSKLLQVILPEGLFLL